MGWETEQRSEVLDCYDWDREREEHGGESRWHGCGCRRIEGSWVVMKLEFRIPRMNNVGLFTRARFFLSKLPCIGLEWDPENREANFFELMCQGVVLSACNDGQP